METARVPAIIIAPPGLLRDSLKVVMIASDRISFVGTGDDWTDGLKMMSDLVPKLVVVDTENLGETFSWQILQQLYDEQTHVIFCVVVHTREEEHQARNIGVQIVLQAGFSTQTFFAAIEELIDTLSQRQLTLDPFRLIDISPLDEPTTPDIENQNNPIPLMTPTNKEVQN